MRPILARLRGEEREPAAKPDDLELIIAHRCSLWLGTEQALYLRPKTLFGTKHFADYLDGARGWDAQGRPALLAKGATSMASSTWRPTTATYLRLLQRS